MTTRASRRHFLKTLSLGSGAAVLGACTAKGIQGPSPLAPQSPPQPAPLPDGLDRAHFHVHRERPLALETRRSSLGSAVLTPASTLFVRNNLPMPSPSILEDREAWTLRVAGVLQEASITLAELKSLGRETVTAVLQCSGNGRAFFDHGPSGSPWSVGAAGCVSWTGVPLHRLVNHLGGAREGMRFVTATGGEVLPVGVDPATVVVERSIPLAKGLDDVLLAWEMNGQPIPLTHGGPLRLVVPGYFGCNQIKYLKSLALSEEESSAKIQQKGYRFRPISEGGAPSQPSMWRMPVKSWVNGPGADDTPVLAGEVHFHGVAFSGERGIDKVEVSLDGEHWEAAEIYGPDMGPNAWRTFRFAVRLDPGDYRVMSRATDTAGDIQPGKREENERGYGYQGWRESALSVRVVGALAGAAARQSNPQNRLVESDRLLLEPPPATAPLDAGQRVFDQATPPCGSCHTLDDAGASGLVGPSFDALKPGHNTVVNAVTNGVGVMPAYGETLSPQEISDLARYVVEASR